MSGALSSTSENKRGESGRERQNGNADRRFELSPKRNVRCNFQTNVDHYEEWRTVRILECRSRDDGKFHVGEE